MFYAHFVCFGYFCYLVFNAPYERNKMLFRSMSIVMWVLNSVCRLTDRCDWLT